MSAQGYALIGKAAIFVHTNDFDQAQDQLNRAKEILKGKSPDTSSTQIRRMLVQSEIDAARGRLTDANRTLTHVVELLTGSGGETNTGLIGAYRQRAEVELRLGQAAAAKDDAAKAVKIAEILQAGNQFSGYTGQADLTLGSVLHAQGDAVAAHAALSPAVKHLANTSGSDFPDTLKAQKMLSEL